jgi:hypothetical protein
MIRKLLVIGLLGYGAYYYYQSLQPGQPASAEPRYSVDAFGNTIEIPPVQIVEEKDLIPVNKLPHTKEHNLLYDAYGNERVRIKHVFSSQVIRNPTM